MYESSNEMGITVACESGTVKCDFRRIRWSWVTEPAGEWNHQAVEVPERDTLYIAQANNFLDAMARGTQPLCTLEEAVQTLRVNLASLRSAREGSWQALGSGTDS